MNYGHNTKGTFVFVNTNLSAWERIHKRYVIKEGLINFYLVKERVNKLYANGQ